MNQPPSWSARLLTPLPDELLKGAVPGDEPRWEYVETELIKLGSLAHAQVDLDAVVEACLGLLESRSKDMRVLAQLLRCQQHPAKAGPLAAAIELLTEWIRAYWSLAWPHEARQKLRLMAQILKRFEGALPRLGEGASATELAHLLAQAERLAACWRELCPEQDALLAPLLTGLKQTQHQPSAQAGVDKAGSEQDTRPFAVPEAASVDPIFGEEARASAVEIDSSNERAWRKTQLRIAELLIGHQPEVAVGYRLRRHAIWAGISAPPLSSRDHKTQLAPMALDRVNGYRTAMATADLALWQQIEQSLILAPYWFEGHHLSALAAERLGHGAVGQAIMQELEAFLLRLPALRTLAFSDGSPFLPPECARWLQPVEGCADSHEGNSLGEAIAQRHSEQGMGAALALLDERMQSQQEPRARFYAQLLQADLLAQEGMKALARQHYQQLWQEASRLGLMQWEPGLIHRLAQLATPLSI